MKKKKPNLQEEVEKTLDSLERIERVEGNPFLFTRVIEQIKSEQAPQTSGNLLWQPALMTLLIVLNVFTAVRYLTVKQAEQRTALIQTLAEDYDLKESGTSTYYLSESN